MKLELFYDVESVYSYIAFTILERYCSTPDRAGRWPLTLTLRPAFLAGVFKAVGNVPPATLPQRAPYLARDMGRQASYVGCDLMIPNDFPAQSLNAMRFLTLVSLEQPHKLADATRALYARHWGQGLPVENELADVVTPLGLAALVSRTTEPAVKEALKKSTDEAVERGAFGFPAMFVDDEMYFGADRLPVLAHELKLPWHGPNPG